jgi:outer membrane protein TolC
VATLLADGLTAEEAVQVALLNNRRLQATFEDLGLARAALIQASLPENPMVEGEIKSHSGEDVVEFTAAQHVLSILLIPLRRATAKADFEEAKQRVTGEVFALAGRTRAAYYRAVAARQALSMLREILHATRAGHEMAKRLRKAGNITELALVGRRALYEQARLATAQAEVGALDAREDLNQLMGLFGGDLAWRPPDAMPPLPEQELDLAGIERRAVAASIELAAGRAQIDALSHRLGIARATSIIPDLELGFVGEREPDHTWFLGPVAAYAPPIFDWGQGRRAAARAKLRRALHEYTANAIEVRAAARTARRQLLFARRKARHYESMLVPISERMTAETQLEYNAMQLGVFQLLAAKQREIDTRRRCIESLRDYWIARTRLAQLLNGTRMRVEEPRTSETAVRMGGEGGGH